MLKVVAAIIVRQGKVLLAKRPMSKHQGGKWEFPGGKIHLNETPINALIRECKEELNINFSHARSFHKVNFEYPEKKVSIEFFWVDDYEGQEQGLEGQEIAWWPIEDLKQLTFPDANLSVVEKLLNES